MTTITAPMFSYAAARHVVLTDTSVTKVALYCATVVLVTALGVIGWVVTTTGDIGAVSFAIGGFLTAVVTAVGKTLKRRSENGGSGDA